MNSPSVSVVLATYNRCDWLRYAMDSVLGQDYADLELLVMDDGSTDETPELLREYAGRQPTERFRFERHENMGQARTLNRGYELARGEVLGYLSDDDLLAPGAVSRLVAELADPEIVAAFPGYRIIDESGKIIDTVRPIPYRPVEAFRLMDTVIGPGCLARREPLLATGGWDPDLRFMGDLILWIKLGEAGTIARVPEPLASWRRHGEGQSLQGGAAHGRELMDLVVLAEQLLDLPPDPLPLRAEALRNACIQAAFFAGGDGTPPGERFATIDLTRAQTCSFAAGLGPEGLLDQGRADEAAALWHELAALIAEVERARSGESRQPARRGAGLEAALRRLRRAGALPGPEGPEAGGWDRRDLRMELMEAAVECGADADPSRSRYLVLDLGGGLSPAEVAGLNHLGIYSPPERLRGAIAERSAELERLGRAPSAADR